MGKRGPQKTPTAILSREGSWRASVRSQVEVKAPAGCPVAPDWLTEAEHEVWEQVVDQLDRIGTLHQTDGNAIGRYCSLLVRWVTAKKFIEEHGDTYQIKDGEGKFKRFATFPQSLTYKHLLPMMLRLEQEFGLTPASRAGLEVKSDRNSEQDLEAVYFA